MLRSIFRYSILSLMIIGMMSSCVNKNARHNNFPEPPYKPLPAGDTITIDSILTLWKLEGSHKFTTDTYVIGTVTGDETSGNLYKAAFIQDPDDNSAIELYMKSTCGLRIGDVVAVYLKDATASEYSGTPQIQDLDPKYITILENEQFIQPAVIPITEACNHLCQVVTFENVQFAKDDLGLTYADTDGYGERTIEQNNYGNTSTIIARTSNYASFANKEIARGNGTFTGIVTLYANGSNTTWQMVIRSVNELKMNGPRFGATGTGTEDDPYDIASAINIQDESEAWVRGYIVGAAKSTTIVTNDDILWEPPFGNEAITKAAVVIANNPDEHNIGNCLVVYLPNNNQYMIRQAVNLVDHPENIHKILKVNGQLKNQYGLPGLKADGNFNLE